MHSTPETLRFEVPCTDKQLALMVAPDAARAIFKKDRLGEYGCNTRAIPVTVNADERNPRCPAASPVSDEAKSDYLSITPRSPGK